MLEQLSTEQGHAGSDTPAYVCIRDRVAVMILDGELSTGAKLPTVREIAAACETGVSTAARAIALLEQEGLVSTHAGRGTYVKEDRETEVRAELYVCMHPALLMNDRHELAFQRFQGLMRAAHRNGVRLTPIASHADFSAAQLVPGRTGIVLFDRNYEADGFAEVAEQATKDGFPACVACHHDGPLPSIGNVGMAAFEMAAGHLLGLGHRRIGFINCPPRRGEGPRSIPSLNYESYLKAFAKRKLRHSPKLYVVAATEYTEDFESETAEAIEKLLMQQPRPTAIVCNNDNRAILALRMLAERGFRVPDDISVMGIDNLRAAESSDPPLTTVDLRIPDQAGAAVDYVVDRIAGREPRDLDIRPRLIRRRSVKPVTSQQPHHAGSASNSGR